MNDRSTSKRKRNTNCWVFGAQHKSSHQAICDLARAYDARISAGAPVATVLDFVRPTDADYRSARRH